MFRAYLLVLFLLVTPLFQGCGVLGFLKGSPKEEAKEAEVTKDEVSMEVTRLRIENLKLKKEVDILRNKTEEMGEENKKLIAKVEGKDEALNGQLRRLREENQRIIGENRLLKEKIQGLQQKKTLRKLKIKVLSGDGNLSSAKRMAKRLMGMDYEIRRIDYAPRSNFVRNTVYFAPEFRNEGRRLVSGLGPKTVLKPLTWPSIFDLIVVTGKNR